MKSAAALLTLIAVPVLVFSACGQGDLPAGSGGSSSGGGTSTAGTNSPTAGTNSPTAGSPTTTGGSSAAGTSATTGGSSAGTGTGTGGSAAGTGPAGGSGGMSGGSSGGTSGGTAGGAQGGGTGLVDTVTGIPNTFGESFKDSFILLPCYGQQQQDCLTLPNGMACPNQSGAFEQQGFTQTETFKLGGTSGMMYAVTFTLNGISEGKYYSGGTRDAGNGAVANADGDTGSDTFYQGGMPVAQEHYNIYKMTVKNPDGSELKHYYLNSFPTGGVGDYEHHNTFTLHYQKTIPVPGGGSVELFIGDSNCHAVDNCGPGVFGTSCTKPRNIPSETNLVIPTKYMGKNVADINTITGAKQPYHAQLIHITVNTVAAM